MKEPIPKDYTLLRGKMKNLKITQEELANRIGIAPATMSLKLSNKYTFSQEEIDDVRKVLSIGINEIGTYFFTAAV